MIKEILNHQFHIFDLDDTLINTRWSYQQAQKTVIREFWPEKTAVQIDELHDLLSWFCQQTGSGNTELYFDLFIRSTISDSQQYSKSLAKALDCYKKQFESHLKFNPAGLQFLEKLLNLGKKIALVSNGSLERQLKKLQLTKLDDVFQKDQIYISGQYLQKYQKPSPFMIQKACSDYKYPANKAVYYGNTLNDVIAANLAGVCSVFLKTTDKIDPLKPKIAHPDYQIKNWEALK